MEGGGTCGDESQVGEEWGESGSRVFGVVVGEFCHGKEAGPVGLLAVAVDAKVPLQYGI